MPTDAQIDRALSALVAEGETVRWYLEQGFEDDSPEVRGIMVREIVRCILGGIGVAASQPAEPVPNDKLIEGEATQADFCQYGLCKPGEKHASWCTEYAPGELVAPVAQPTTAQILALKPLAVPRDDNVGFYSQGWHAALNAVASTIAADSEEVPPTKALPPSPASHHHWSNQMNDPRIVALATLEIGTPVEGGFFSGYFNGPGGRYGLVTAPKALGEIKGLWLRKPKDVPAAMGCFDGHANTLAMAEAGSDLAKQILALDFDGCADWYIPSRDELEMQYRAFKPTTQANYCSFRDGDNASSIPVGYPYTAELPAQTTVAAFQTGGAEAFDAKYYWSSTQFAGGCAFCQHFSDGDQLDCFQLNELLARAVRRFKA